MPKPDIAPTTAQSIADDIANGMLANIAYPTMRREAAYFTFRSWLLGVFMVVFSLFTFTLSWEVGTGNILLANDEQARTEFAGATTDILTAQQGGSLNSAKPGTASPADANGANGGSAGQNAREKQNAPILGYGPEDYCQPPAPTAPNPKAGRIDNRVQTPINQIALCANYFQKRGRLAMAEGNLLHWNATVQRKWAAYVPSLAAGLTPWEWNYAKVPIPPDPREVDTRWAALWLHVIGGIVLPILYGVLGAGAAAGRMLSAKIRDNTLSPRDGMLAWTHVGLGSLIGGCIGLFVNPSDPSALSEVSHLSTAAVCFLAGFSVDAVFQLLERLTAAVFNVQANAGPKKS